MTDKKNNVRNIFETIAGRYDFLNHLLSFGLDFYWRKKALNLSGVNKDTILLDVACGTGDFSIAAKKFGVKKIFGADFSYNMLQEFNKKSNWIKGNSFQSTAEALPLRDESVTNIIVAFGIRNFYDISLSLNNFHRVIKPGGMVTILEFCLPDNRVIKLFYNLYFKYILPLIGGLISRSYKSYKYLPDSVQEFDEKVNLEKMLKESGFTKIIRKNITLGTVQIVLGVKE